MVYPPIRTPRLPVVDWTETPADLNGLVRFAERPNLVSARVPSRFERALQVDDGEWVRWLREILMCGENSQQWGEKPAPMPLYPPEIQYELPW